MRSILTLVATVGLMGAEAAAQVSAAGDPSPAPKLTLDLADMPTSAPAGGNAQELAKKLSNPVADLISIPLQLNFDEGYGPKGAGAWRLNIQPVIPITLDQNWNLITRTIVPVVYQGSMADGIDSNFGLGDTVQSFFFSPKLPANGWIWGVGPAFNWPTATDTALGSEKWGAGPTAVLLRQDNGWTYGILANHIWSFAGSSDRESLNVTFLQPFLAYTWPTATTVTLNTESTYNWDSHDWTVPINLQVSQLLKVGKLPVQLGLGGRYYAESPDGGPEWGLRFTLTFLLPR